MRRLALLAVALLAVTAPAGGIPLQTSVRTEFTDCLSTGSTAQTLQKGDYLLRITDSDTTLCFAASGSTCASGGEKFPVGTVILLNITGDQVSASCRSSASTGDAVFTRSY